MVRTDFATADGTATAGSDYRAASGTVTFAPNDPRPTPGWTLTPTFAFSQASDSNITLAGQGTPVVGDSVASLSPSIDLSYAGRTTALNGGYAGPATRYFTVDQLDTFDQRLYANLKQQVGRRVQLFAQESAGWLPATDTILLTGVPFGRVGSRIVSIEGGATIAVTRTTELTGGYRFEHADAIDLPRLLRARGKRRAEKTDRNPAEERSPWKFLWAPIGDYTLSRKRWYLISIAAISIGLLAMTAVPLTRATAPLLSALTLLTTVAATFSAFATEGLMAHNTTPATRGRAAGWFQAGNQFGQTAGGGIALWLIVHSPAPWMGALALAALVSACALALVGLEEPRRALTGASVTARVADAWRELVDVLRSRAGRIAMILAILPIGTGAAMFLFPSLYEGFGLPPGTPSTGKMITALRRLGFDGVFDTDLGADLTIMEEAEEFLKRLNGQGPLPILTSCSPGWINFMEKFYPELKEVNLLDYKVRILSTKAGTAAQTRVLIESGDRESKWGTVGVSENIIEASWQALVDSIDYKLLKEEEKGREHGMLPRGRVGRVEEGIHTDGHAPRAGQPAGLDLPHLLDDFVRIVETGHGVKTPVHVGVVARALVVGRLVDGEEGIPHDACVPVLEGLRALDPGGAQVLLPHQVDEGLPGVGVGRDEFSRPDLGSVGKPYSDRRAAFDEHLFDFARFMDVHTFSHCGHGHRVCQRVCPAHA